MPHASRMSQAFSVTCVLYATPLRNTPFRYQGPLIVGASEMSRQDVSLIVSHMGGNNRTPVKKHIGPNLGLLR